ncbi:2-hydroxyglutaryl-CoA dehydratase [Desulfocarbo indianensis]|nr:2-hydroxyglutaryl-CoA dehydratase [Desulfocarbo indianensis]
MPITVGIDVGSISTKAVLLRDGAWQSRLRPTGASPKTSAVAAVEELLAQAGLERGKVDYLIATGYGRGRVEIADKKVTEITCHAKGAQSLAPGADMVIDIGGQDSKVIKTDGQGGVLDFSMNDKCAAGTGRFLEVMAGALDTEVGLLGELAREAEPVEISSMCTVFAESEVISLLAQDVPRERVVAGIHRAVARRVAAMAQRLGLGQLIVFTGGVAKNQGVRRALGQALGREIMVHPHCQLAGALGAALLAAEQTAAQ